MDTSIYWCKYCRRKVLWELSEEKDGWVHKCQTTGKKVVKKVLGAKRWMPGEDPQNRRNGR
ncbi:hypothetical protein ES705_43573 [subsurface metagenome]